MARTLSELIWWAAHHGWRALRALSGDDAYERYVRSTAAADTPLSRARFFEARMTQKWDRLAACGRVSDLKQ